MQNYFYILWKYISLNTLPQCIFKMIPIKIVFQLFSSSSKHKFTEASKSSPSQIQLTMKGQGNWDCSAWKEKRPYCTFCLHKGNLQESWRGAFYMGKHSFKQKGERFASDVRKKFFTMRKHWNSLPRKVDALLLKVFRARLDKPVSNLAKPRRPCPRQRVWKKMFFKVPSSQTVPWFHKHGHADCRHVWTRL